MAINKPKLWNYKTGIKAGKLRPLSKIYLKFKQEEYWQSIYKIQAQTITTLKEARKIKDDSLKVIEKAEKIIKEKPKRTRTQKVLNAESNGAMIPISIRAISFNDKFSIQDLENALNEFLNSNPYLLNIPFGTEGIEINEEIDSQEDLNLDQNIITIELNIRGATTYT